MMTAAVSASDSRGRTMAVLTEFARLYHKFCRVLCWAGLVSALAAAALAAVDYRPVAVLGWAAAAASAVLADRVFARRQAAARARPRSTRELVP